MKSFENLIKKYWLKLTIVLIFLAIVGLIVSIKIQQKYDNNPGLIPPLKNYDIQVELTPEQEMEYETNIIEAERKINETIASGKQHIELQSGAKSNIAMIPDMSLFVDKATNLELLGRYTQAIETMNEAFRKWYDKDINGWNHLANIYIELKEYELAIKLYNRIIEEYPQNTLEFLPVIIATYIKLGDKEAAGQNYIHYELSGGKRDETLMQGIRQLK